MQTPILPNIRQSHLRLYLTDRQAFFKRYIRGEYDGKVSLPMAMGSMYHQSIAIMYGVTGDGTSDTLSYIRSEYPEDFEKSISTVADRVVDYTASKDMVPAKHVLAIEHQMQSTISNNDGELQPIPLSGTIDAAYKAGEDVVIVDHKLVSSYTDPDKLNPGYMIQACAYMTLWENSMGVRPVRCDFLEMKKSKNRDGSPQLRVYSIPYDELNMAIFRELVDRMLRELHDGRLVDKAGIQQFLPNPYQQFGWEEGWNDFVEEVKISLNK